MAKAIAVALSHPFGVGNAYFRIGAQAPLWVDTVPYGCYRQEVFARIGIFDEYLVRNQDDEFNLRLRKNGGRTLLVPEIVIDYFARKSLFEVWRMYYQYGYFKALVARKLGLVLGLRQIIPSLLVFTFVVSFLLGWWFPLWGVLGFLVFLAYVLADVTFALRAGRGHGWAVTACLILVFPAVHFSYGLGFLQGLVDFVLLGKKGVKNVEDVPLSR